jgi:hypothetical protein
MAQKYFNCPSCGPVENGYVFGDAIDPDFHGLRFVVIRTDVAECLADLDEEGKQKFQADSVSKTAKALAAVEDYCANEGKIQCTKCGSNFKLRKPAPQSPATGQNTNGPTAQTIQQMFGGGQPGAMQGSFDGPAVMSRLDQKFTDQELDDWLTEMGEDPNNYADRNEKLTGIVDRLS